MPLRSSHTKSKCSEPGYSLRYCSAFVCFGFEFGFLSGLRGSSFLFRLIQFGNRHKHRKLCQPVLGGLIAWSDEDFGIEVGIGIIGDLAQLQGCIRCRGRRRCECPWRRSPFWA